MQIFKDTFPQKRISQLGIQSTTTETNASDTGLISNAELFENLRLWVKEFFNGKKAYMNFPFNENQNKNLMKKSSSKSNYLEFRDVTNPAMPTIVMNNLISLNSSHLLSSYEVAAEEDETGKNNLLAFKKQKLDIVKIWRAWNDCFAELGSEFRLKIVFAEFLTKFELDYEDKKKIELLQNFFLKICHEMYLLGYI